MLFYLILDRFLGDSVDDAALACIVAGEVVPG